MSDTDQQRHALGQRVEAARIAKGWSKERAAREAGVSSITLKRVEDGLSVQDAKLGAVLDALDLRGAPPLVEASAQAGLTAYDDTELLAELLTRASRRLREERDEQPKPTINNETGSGKTAAVVDLVRSSVPPLAYDSTVHEREAAYRPDEPMAADLEQDGDDGGA